VVARRRGVESLDGTEALIVRYTQTLLREHEVPDELFDAAKGRFGVQGVTELTATIGYYAMLACVLNAFEVTGSSP
jgi:4-carboxymuconolactone decarboxylase